jgi:hypothetical protein
MQFNKDFGNTGLGIATKLRRHGGAGQLYNILTGVTPTITVDQLRRLTYEEVLERASKVLELAYLDGVSRVANYPIKDEADLCVIGDVGFSTKSISGFFIGPTQDLGQVTRVVYLPTQYNLAHIAHTWGGTSAIYFTVSYIDNISAWVGGENSISIIRSGYFNNNFNRAGVVGLIELPPEEWDFSLKMEYRYSSTYNVILEKIAQAKHKVNIAATAATIDLSKIYEGPNARTLVMVGNFTVHYNNVANWLDGRIMVNGEVLGKRFYRVAVMQWSNRVYQNSVNTGNAIAKTLLKTIAVNLEYKEYNILNGFPGYPSISEQTYINMTDEEINERADALMTYAAMEEGHPPYKKLNEVIEVDTGLCPINPE